MSDLTQALTMEERVRLSKLALRNTVFLGYLIAAQLQRLETGQVPQDTAFMDATLRMYNEDDIVSALTGIAPEDLDTLAAGYGDLALRYSKRVKELLAENPDLSVADLQDAATKLNIVI